MAHDWVIDRVGEWDQRSAYRDKALELAVCASWFQECRILINRALTIPGYLISCCSMEVLRDLSARFCERSLRDDEFEVELELDEKLVSRGACGPVAGTGDAGEVAPRQQVQAVPGT